MTVTLLSGASFIQPVKRGEVEIKLQTYVGEQPLKMDALIYKNEAGQQFSVSKFRYYISNVQLETKNGSQYVSGGYYLVDEDEPASGKLILKDVPEAEYTSIHFMIGVDSLHNCSGAQSGALDPVNGMFWSWNTGYIFLKLEGKSPASTSPGHIFEFHIGGYKAPANCIRNITLPLGDKKLAVTAGKNATLNIKVDIAQMLKAPYPIDLSKLSSVTDFHNATTIADNYAHLFSILNIE